MLQQALAMSLEVGGAGGSTQAKGSTAAKPVAAPKAAPAAAVPDFSAMTEEEQIAYAMQISMQDCGKDCILFQLPLLLQVLGMRLHICIYRYVLKLFQLTCPHFIQLYTKNGDKKD